MFGKARRRYLDLLASIYIYNEHRGYRSLDRVLEALLAKFPGEASFIADVRKHRADERKHYLMFRHYFERLGRMPFEVDRACGHIDRLIKATFGCHIDDLDTRQVIADDRLFQKLCRIILLTEVRGMHQVDILLQSFSVRSDQRLLKIFRVIERDEPSHWMPYKDWLDRTDGGAPHLLERIADFLVHRSLVFYKLPILYLNPSLARRRNWHDEEESASILAAEVGQ